MRTPTVVGKHTLCGHTGEQMPAGQHFEQQTHNPNQLIEAPRCQQKHFPSNVLAELVTAHLCAVQNGGASERAKLH